ncbi:hypothetical protein [Litoreibacter janthinus]|uniref:hypothetical protein n=1 Tax=Litoreibacter janthinus TaxID=670154 RepID=UPI000B7F4165|nr:hypothetical protein [Litoreibacter janthinus]
MGWLSLTTAWLTHEIISFGLIHGFLTGEKDLPFYLYPSGLSEIVLVSLLMAAVCALPFGPVAYVFKSVRFRQTALGNLWLVICFWGYFTTASGYRSHFGATWYW